MRKSPSLEKAVVWIREYLREHAHAKLPPVRSLARMVRVSVVTIIRALAVLKEEGVLTGIWGKGYFPAGVGQAENAFEYAPHNNKRRNVIEAIKQGILDGKFRMHYSLPSQSRLALLYNVSVPTIGKALLALVNEKVLTREGTRYFLFKDRLLQRRRVAVIALGEEAERPKIISEREKTFYRLLSSAAADLAVDLEIICYNDYLDAPAFFPPEGHTIESYVAANRICGIVLSSYHMSDSVGCLRKLIGCGVPVSVWIEDQGILRSADRFGPRYERLTFFDSSYSPLPGKEVGRYLFDKGHREIAYLSPFHGSVWSKNRLEGLKKAASAFKDPRAVHAFVLNYASDYAFLEEILDDPAYDTEKTLVRMMENVEPAMTGRAHSVQNEYETLLRDTLIFAKCKKLIDNASSMPGITAWVCANDLIAGMVMDFWNHTGVTRDRRPALIGFDNSFLSLERKVSTYDFNTAGEVRSMLGHLLHRGGMLSSGRDYLVRVNGTVIERASSMGPAVMGPGVNGQSCRLNAGDPGAKTVA